jgi:hypothetical protein
MRSASIGAAAGLAMLFWTAGAFAQMNQNQQMTGTMAVEGGTAYVLQGDTLIKLNLQDMSQQAVTTLPGLQPAQPTLFSALDDDGDGQLTQGELGADLWRQVGEFDQDQSGGLSHEEWAQARRQIAGGAMNGGMGRGRGMMGPGGMGMMRRGGGMGGCPMIGMGGGHTEIHVSENSVLVLSQGRLFRLNKDDLTLQGTFNVAQAVQDATLQVEAAPAPDQAEPAAPEGEAPQQDAPAEQEQAEAPQEDVPPAPGRRGIFR